MKFKTYMEVELWLDDIDEIINQLLWYLYDPKEINEVDELYVAVKSIPSRITEIKNILLKEMMKNESYFESQIEG